MPPYQVTPAPPPAPSRAISVPEFPSIITQPDVEARITGVVIFVVNVGSSFGAFSVSS